MGKLCERLRRFLKIYIKEYFYMNPYTLACVGKFFGQRKQMDTRWQKLTARDSISEPVGKISVTDDSECEIENHCLPAVVKWTFERFSRKEGEDELHVTLERTMPNTEQASILCHTYEIDFHQIADKMKYKKKWTSLIEIWVMSQFQSPLNRFQFTQIDKDGNETSIHPPPWAAWSSVKHKFSEMLFVQELKLEQDTYHGHGQVFAVDLFHKSKALEEALLRQTAVEV